MIIINGKEIADKKLTVLEKEVQALEISGVTPSLAIIIVGSDPASQIYVRNKALDSKRIGIKAEVFNFPAHKSEEELLGLIDSLNKDQSVHGIIVQLPLPPHINKRRLLNAVWHSKDVDGFNEINVGRLYSAEKSGFAPCTPVGCLQIIKSEIQDLTGKHAVVVGRSDIVGRPMASIFLQENCTVTICHSYTQNLDKIMREADIVVTAIGKPSFFDKSYFNQNAFVVDVGINRIEKDGAMRLTGDVNFDDVAPYVKYITPVPGGVGPMTRACLLENTIKSAKQIYASKTKS